MTMKTEQITVQGTSMENQDRRQDNWTQQDNHSGERTWQNGPLQRTCGHV